VTTGATVKVRIDSMSFIETIAVPQMPMVEGATLAKFTFGDLPANAELEYDIQASGTFDVLFDAQMPDIVRFHSVRDTLIQVHRWMADSLFPKFAPFFNV
jgi:hypothetical protein